MTWSQRHTIHRYLKASLWPIPLVSIVVAPIVAHSVLWLDRELGWTLDVSADAARTIGTFLAGSMLSFIVFIFTVLLVAVQLASAQFSPRVIARVFRDPFTKVALGVFVFVYTYSVVFLLRLREPVPLISGILCGYGSLACVAVFLFLIDRLGKELRPVRILTVVAAEGRKVIARVYPRKLTDRESTRKPAESIALGTPSCTIEHTGGAGVVLEINVVGLVKLAQQCNCVIELVPQVGDFLPTDDPLFRLYGGGQSIDDRVLRGLVALGRERTLEQDPAFAFRIIVDIASKALSPAINDPTTAVLAIDQLHHLLRLVGARELDTGQERDGAGTLRLVYRTPDWEDFVHLAVTEIRQFGGESIQVARRLRAMLIDLIQTLSPERSELLRRELSLLHRSTQRYFTEPEDHALAEISDVQGVGGSPKRNETLPRSLSDRGPLH